MFNRLIDWWQNSHWGCEREIEVFTCSSKEMTLGWIFSKVKWYTALAVASGRLGRCVQKSVSSCLEMTRLTFSLTTEIERHRIYCKKSCLRANALSMLKKAWSNWRTKRHSILASTKAFKDSSWSASVKLMAFSSICRYLQKISQVRNNFLTKALQF